MIEVIGHSEGLLEELKQFRERVFLKAKRDPDVVAEWSMDEQDLRATHIIARDDEQRVIGAVRMLLDGPWHPIEEVVADLDTSTSVFTGRMAVDRMEFRGRRVLVDLLLHAAWHAISMGRSTCYAAPNSRMLALYQRLGLPFQEVPGLVESYGVDLHVISSRLDEAIPVLKSVVGVRPRVASRI